ncbi:MAG TPA: helix-turn-helix domain-containing protein [Pyrinomonadaceae bacterium]|nr:helix-turn-helix domain-containing protein [Pyrinomonadaceae bacterium]
MNTITSISDYCREINVPPPRHDFFDIRRFKDNMRTVNARQPPFRHEFYAVALRHEGSNREVMGRALSSNLFFNSPYQIVTWDILPDWTGWYIIFDREFIALNPAWQNFLIDFPFFRLDRSIRFDLPEESARFADGVFQNIFDEYHSENGDKFLFIQAYTHLLLLLTKRHFLRIEVGGDGLQENRTADVLLVSRFQSLLEVSFGGEHTGGEIRHPSYYAGRLHVHPNYLNAVVKRITGSTAIQLIQNHVLTQAKSLLLQTDLPVKEIAFRLQFSEPTHFNAFFRKFTSQTPQQFRGK